MEFYAPPHLIRRKLKKVCKHLDWVKYEVEVLYENGSLTDKEHGKICYYIHCDKKYIKIAIKCVCDTNELICNVRAASRFINKLCRLLDCDCDCDHHHHH